MVECKDDEQNIPHTEKKERKDEEVEDEERKKNPRNSNKQTRKKTLCIKERRIHRKFSTVDRFQCDGLGNHDVL